MAPELLISPSILSADLGRLGEEIRDAEAAGVDWIHVDVIDGRFAPNLTMGTPIVKAARRATTLPLDVHLMIVEPERYIDAFAAAGADIISIHVEACTHLQRALSQIRALGKRAGVVLNPSTHESAIEYVMEDVDMVLVMSVNPGFSGQSFLPSQLKKIERIATWIAASGCKVDLEVDGGVAPDTIRSVVNAGANVLVAGAAVFGQTDRKAAVASLRRAARG
jgi:ribulose-phosphate 3-epimerase